MSEEVDIELPPKLVPIFEGEARYRASFGGRGGAKSRAFAMMTDESTTASQA